MATYVILSGNKPSQPMLSARMAVTFILDRMLWFGFRMREVEIIKNRIKISPIQLIAEARYDVGEDYDY